MKRKTSLLIFGILVFLCYLYHVAKISMLSHEKRKRQLDLRSKFKKTFNNKTKNIKEIDPFHRHLVKENSLLIDGIIKNSTRYTKKEKIQKLPEVILIGASKSGTRALINYLGLHPSIAIAGPEIHFFDENYRRGYEWYRKQMPFSYSNQLTMEKTPAYFITPDVPQLIHKWNPNVKLLLIIRNPVIRAVSEFAQILRKRNIKYDPEKYDKASKLFGVKVLYANGVVKVRSYYIRNGMYISHLKRWLKYFPLDQLMILDGEKLLVDPYNVVRKVENFLNLEPFFKKEIFVYNDEKGFMCIQRQVDAQSKCLGEGKGSVHPFIEEKVLSRLKEFYEPLDKWLFKTIKTEPFWKY